MTVSELSRSRVDTAASDIVAFWLRLPRFFLYPFHLGAIAMALVFMALAYVAQFTDYANVVLALVSIACVRYGYAVLENTARGQLTAENLFGAGGVETGWRPYKQWIIFAAIVMLTAAAAQVLGGRWSYVVCVLMLLALPASMMSLAVSDDLLAAVHPHPLGFIVGELGWAYAGLALAMLLLSALAWTAWLAGDRWAPPALALPASFGLALYFGLALFNLIGYTLYQYHVRLGLDVQRAPPLHEPDATERIAQMMDENRIRDALKLAYEVQRLHPDDVDAHDRYHKLMRLAGATDSLERHAQRFIPLLLGKQRHARAVEVYAACRETHPEFRLQNAADQLRLARAVAPMRDADVVAHLLRDFDQHYPGAAEIAGAWLLQAKTMTDRSRDDHAAAQLLRLMLARYPRASEASEAKQYLAVLESMAKLKEGPRRA